MLTAAEATLERESHLRDHKISLEGEVLGECAASGRLAAGTFHAGETMLIAPGGGHAVLTGDEGKVVVAGEWHLRATGTSQSGS